MKCHKKDEHNVTLHEFRRQASVADICFNQVMNIQIFTLKFFEAVIKIRSDWATEFLAAFHRVGSHIYFDLH